MAEKETPIDKTTLKKRGPASGHRGRDHVCKEGEIFFPQVGIHYQ